MKIGIVARASTARLAPFGNEAWTLWGLPWVRYPRIDAVFEVHEQTRYDQVKITYDPSARNPEAVVYCPPCRDHAYEGMERKRYPLRAVRASLPFAPLENTVCYQLALALHLGATEIGLWGVHMTTEREHLRERAGVLYFIGLAHGRGVRITIPPGCPLLMSHWEAGRYGVDGAERIIVA